MKQCLAIFSTFFLGVALFFLCEKSESMPTDVVCNMDLHSMNIVLQQGNSFDFVMSESSSPLILPVKGNRYHSNAYHFHDTGASHTLNSVIAISNSRVVCFSRSVDKYIYVLRRIII